MMLKFYVSRLSSLSLMCAIMLATSCKEEEEPARLTLQDAADLTDEAMTEAYFQDLDDMAGVAIETPSETQYSNGRISTSITIQDHRFNCDGIVVTLASDVESTTETPKGVLIIDFGSSGCTDMKGNVRKGKVLFAYNGKRFMPGSAVVTTTDNYFINGVRLEGIRTLTNAQNSTQTAPRFNVVLKNGKATFPNTLTATRESDITWQWNRALNPLEDNLEIETTSEASGVTRSGRMYRVEVVEPLLFKRHCGIPVSGVKKYMIDGEKVIRVDYGDGNCDRSFSLKVNGVTKDITF